MRFGIWMVVGILEKSKRGRKALFLFGVYELQKFRAAPGCDSQRIGEWPGSNAGHEKLLISKKHERPRGQALPRAPFAALTVSLIVFFPRQFVWPAMPQLPSG